MHRWIAKFLLSAALVGNFGPLAQAAMAAPPHACCVRKSVHHCHDSLSSKTEQPAIRDAGCCANRCGHAAITIRWAHTPAAGTSWAQTAESYVGRSIAAHLDSPNTRFESTRAPPHFPLV